MARLCGEARPDRQGRRSAGRSWIASAQRHRARDRPDRMAACAARRNFRNARCSNCCGGRDCAPARSDAHVACFFDRVDLTLEHICEGGIYDHLGGGFSRYSVDEHWLVPHFEKMLYDNAQLLELLALAHGAHRQAAVPRARRGDRRLARARDDHAGGRVLRLARRRLRKARRASSTSGRWPRSTACSGRTMLRFSRSITT